jgi:hypothetical protein
VDVNLGKPRPGGRANAPHQLYRQVVKEIELGAGIDNHQPIGFRHLRSNFRQVLEAKEQTTQHKLATCKTKSAKKTQRLRESGCDRPCRPPRAVSKC